MLAGKVAAKCSRETHLVGSFRCGFSNKLFHLGQGDVLVAIAKSTFFQLRLYSLKMIISFSKG